MVGRPKEFDEKRALQRAMDVFWTHGYEATSVQDLVDAMGINRASMYDTFGDKHALFTAAVEHYGATAVGGMEETLAAEGSPLKNIHRLLLRMADPAGDGRCRGCLTTNTAVELAPHDAEAREVVKRLLGRTERALRKALQRAIDRGELSSDADIPTLARFLLVVVQGIVVLGKMGASRGALRDVVSVTCSVLK